MTGVQTCALPICARAAMGMVIERAFTARVGDVTVRLVGVAVWPPTKPGAGWLPNGWPGDGNPPKQTGVASGARRRRGFFVEAVGVRGDSQQIFVDVAPAASGGGGSESRKDDRVLLLKHKSIPPGIQRVAVDVGVETGPWTKVAAAPLGESAKLPGGGEVAFGRLRPADEGLQLTCTFHQQAARRYRIALRMADGTTVHSGNWGLQIGRAHV